MDNHQLYPELLKLKNNVRVMELDILKTLRERCEPKDTIWRRLYFDLDYMRMEYVQILNKVKIFILKNKADPHMSTFYRWRTRLEELTKIDIPKIQHMLLKCRLDSLQADLERLLDRVTQATMDLFDEASIFIGRMLFFNPILYK